MRALRVREFEMVLDRVEAVCEGAPVETPA